MKLFLALAAERQAVRWYHPVGFGCAFAAEFRSVRPTRLDASTQFRGSVLPNRIIVLMLAAFISLLAASCSRPPSDAEVTEHFERNSANLATLLAMLQQDTNVATIAPNFAFSTDRPFLKASATQLGITEGRLAEYRKRLRDVGVLRVDRNDDNNVGFTVWGKGFAGHTHHKGISWMKRAPPEGGLRRYAHIRDNWYVFQD